ncbi:MAG: patatin-like phospholipase family protein, partial [Myxococcota bacterium]
MSSGFLAFGAHTGFLAGVEELGLPVEAVCGTSSGALIGALWAAGMPAREVYAEVTRHPPLAWARPHARPWRGVLSLGPMID